MDLLGEIDFVLGPNGGAILDPCAAPQAARGCVDQSGGPTLLNPGDYRKRSDHPQLVLGKCVVQDNSVERAVEGLIETLAHAA